MDQTPISVSLISGAAVFSIVWFLRSLSMATAAGLLTWGTSTWLQSERKFKEKELITVVAGVLAWGVSKFLVGQFVGAMVGGVVGWIIYKMLEEEERRKKRVEEVVSGVLGVGAAALAAWGMSKAFHGESSSDEDKMMKAPGRGGSLMPRNDFEKNLLSIFAIFVASIK